MRPRESSSGEEPGSALVDAAEALALRQALHRAEEAQAQAEAADKAKSELLALVSHELRTPMGAVIAMAELMLAGSLEDTQRRYGETLLQSARSLLSILNDILDYSKLEAQRFELDAAPFDLVALLDEVRTGLKARADAKGIAAEVVLAEGCPRHLIGDGGRLRQILTNLTDNAVKFTDRGSVRLEVDGEESDGELMLTFAVKDTGIGLSESECERLFLPYVQVDRKIASQFGGTGLGLSIAKRLAELMGGRIACESYPGEGSRFWFTVPMRQVEAVSHRQTQTAERDGLQGRVLVVEDNGVNRMLIGAYLEEFGVDYVLAPGGKEALEAIKEQPFDLVLMDIMMPEMDGIETSRRIRALAGAAGKVPIVALTANAMAGDREAYLAAGMDAYVSKPVRGRELYEQIAAYLRPQRMAQSDAAQG